MTSPGSDLLATTAMARWVAGAASGDWSGLVDLLDADVTFSVPVPGFSGTQRGLAAATRFFDHLSEVLRAELTVTATMRADDRVGFEVTVHGVWQDRAFVQALCLVFVGGDGRIREFREYLAWPGGLDPAGGGAVESGE